jgi:SAM-dependent methyltransferase
MDNALKERLASSYDRHARKRDRQGKEGWKIEERDHFLARLAPLDERRLLEIGAGTGHDSHFFDQMGLRTFTTDLSHEMARLCREKGLLAAVMSFEHLAFPRASFDAVWALNCLLHVPRAEISTVLQEVRRVLKPGGLFYMGLYGGRDSEGIWEDDHYRPRRFFSFYTDEAVQEVAAQFFALRHFKRIPLQGNSLHFQSLILQAAPS